ncbi:NAD(P)-dependent oxidoreductase [Amycolatopsis coloradensis]|uniref:NAD(P)-dependent oxidoreductase n=1 Tax=Amycolatopsis coloradensis TaxID=76021 RepID=UPI001FCA4875|nr:NAD(P)-dependent oxidoreductase [Amycolatopsis coloradensis]
MKILISDETDDRVGVDLLDRLDGADVVTYDPTATELDQSQRAAEIMIPPYRGSHRPLELLSQLPHLRMVQLLSAGSDEWAPYVPGHVMLASGRGGHAHAVSEWILSAILCQYRGWPSLLNYQHDGVWAHRKVEADTVAGKKTLIVGAGHIGLAAAKRLQLMDAEVTLVGRIAREGVHTAADLPALVPDHDIVVIAAPLTTSTRGLFGKNMLATMPDGSLLVNAGRGEIIDTDALLLELNAGRLRAALDVTDPEPLPAGHPLYTAPGVIISPHMSRTVPGTNERCYQVAAEQVATFLAGCTPSNAVLDRQ